MSVKLALLGKNIGIYSLGNIALRAAAFLLIPLYTRYLSVDSYGLLDLCIITMQILIIFMGLGMPQGLVRFYNKHELNNEAGILFTSSISLNLMGCMAMGILIIILHGPMSRLIFSVESSPLLLLVSSVAVARSLTQSSLSYFRAKNQALAYTTIALGIMIGLMAFNVYFVIILKKGISGILYGYLIVYGVAAVTITAFILSKSKPRYSPYIARKLLVFGLPLIFSMSGWFIIQMSSRYFLANFSGLTEVGIYGLGYRIVTILQIVIVMPFQLAFGPFIFSHEKDLELKAKVSTILTYLLALLFAATWLTGFLSKLIIKIMAPQEYQQAHMVVLLILPTIIAIGVYYWSASLLHLKNKTQWIGAFIACSAIVNVFLNLWLIPKYGWYGAAIATNISIFLAMALNFFSSQKFFKITFEKRRLYQLFFVFLVLCSVLIFTLELKNLAYYGVNGGAFILMAILLYNSKSFKEEFKIDRQGTDV